MDMARPRKRFKATIDKEKKLKKKVFSIEKKIKM